MKRQWRKILSQVIYQFLIFVCSIIASPKRNGLPRNLRLSSGYRSKCPPRFWANFGTHSAFRKGGLHGQPKSLPRLMHYIYSICTYSIDVSTTNCVTPYPKYKPIYCAWPRYVMFLYVPVPPTLPPRYVPNNRCHCCDGVNSTWRTV